MQCTCLYDTTAIKEQNIDTKTTHNIAYNYKQKREALNQIVKNHIAKQKKNLTHKTVNHKFEIIA